MMTPTPEIVSSSPPDVLAAMDVVICIPTYKRPELLRRALASVLRQTLSRKGDPRVGIVVVDNDGLGREGAALAAGLLANAGMPFVVLVEPRQGNCKAYNAAWHHVRTVMPNVSMICGLDDDEEAADGWLIALLDAARTSGASIVGGPVRPIFSDVRFEHLRKHPIFRSHYENDGPVPQLYSSANYLMRTVVLDYMEYPYLDEAFDYKGGGDTDFFTRARARGVRFQWASKALLTETLPPRRTEFSWIQARSLRNGMISALIAHKANPGGMGRLRTVLKSLLLLIAAPARGLIDLIQTGSGVIALYHAQVALGRIGAEFGLNIEQYRNPEKN